MIYVLFSLSCLVFFYTCQSNKALSFVLFICAYLCLLILTIEYDLIEKSNVYHDNHHVEMNKNEFLVFTIIADLLFCINKQILFDGSMNRWVFCQNTKRANILMYRKIEEEKMRWFLFRHYWKRNFSLRFIPSIKTLIDKYFRFLFSIYEHLLDSDRSIKKYL